MKASKWTNPTTGEVRVYLSGFKGGTKTIKAFATADKDGDAIVTVTGGEFSTQKQLENIKADIRKNFGLYVKFSVYLSACPAVAEKVAIQSNGSDFGNSEADEDRTFGIY